MIKCSNCNSSKVKAITQVYEKIKKLNKIKNSIEYKCLKCGARFWK